MTFMKGSGAFVEGQLAGENRSRFLERNRACPRQIPHWVTQEENSGLGVEKQKTKSLNHGTASSETY
jgi:hypothetical protein